MQKLKIFKFRMSDHTGKADLIDLENGVRDAEDTINDFIKNKELLSISATAVDVNYHNNGRDNTIDLVYNIIYKEETMWEKE